LHGVEAIARPRRLREARNRSSEAHMMDVVYIGLTAVLAAMTWGLVRLFDKVA
jgi:hypothetical protein